MNLAATRFEMLACIVALREKLTGIVVSSQRRELAEQTRRQIERIRKRFKRKVDERARRRFGFAVHERESIEAELTEATTVALAWMEESLAELAEPRRSG